MARTRFQLTDAERAKLQASELHEKDGATRARLQGVRLYTLGFEMPLIQTITGLSRTRIMECCRAYREHGIEGLRDHRVGGNNRKLTPEQLSDLRTRLQQYTPKSLFGPAAATPSGQFWTLSDLRRALTQWYGVTYSSTRSYYQLFARCGFSYQRPDRVFKSRREADVVEWEQRCEKN
jgi:transposase